MHKIIVSFDQYMENKREEAMWTDHLNNVGASSLRSPLDVITPGPWQETPWWQFWQPSHCRLAWRVENGPGSATWIPYWEYQPVEFVAREALEKQFGEEYPPYSKEQT